MKYLILLILVAGCKQDEEPVPAPTPTATPAITATPIPTPRPTPKPPKFPPTPVQVHQNCGDGCFEVADPFTPSVAEPVRRLNINVREGDYKKISVFMKVKIAKWNPAHPENPNATHSLFWLVKNESNKDMIGYLILKSKKLMARYWMGVRHVEKARCLTGISPKVGEEVSYSYIYDMENKEVIINGIKCGAAPNTDVLHIGSVGRMTMDLGLRVTPNLEEVPSYGWKYSAIKVEFIK